MEGKRRNSVAEGIEVLKEEPACGIVDLRLSDGTGEALLSRIRETRLVSRIVVCTALRDAYRLDGLPDFKPDPVIHKLVEMNELVEAGRT